MTVCRFPIRLLQIIALAVASLLLSHTSLATPCTTDLTPYLATYSVKGLAAGIVKNGQLVCTAVAGQANVEQNSPVTPDTDFLIASVSKTVTATALLQLYEQGLFGLDDPVNDHLPFAVQIPTCPNTPITIRQLLTHTSSIQDNDDLLIGLTVAGDSPIQLADFAPDYFVPNQKYYDPSKNFLATCPGTQYKYSNMGATLIGYLVQYLSAQEFNQHVTDHVFTSLAMPNSSYFLSGLDATTLALPYPSQPQDYCGGTFCQYGEPDFPDGMVRTSIEQLSHFLLMYMNGGIYAGHAVLQPQTVQMMLSSQSSVHGANDLAQGLIWYETAEFHNGAPVWGHNGSDDGAAANMFFDPVAKEGVILFANGEWSGDAVALMNALFTEADGY